MTNKEAMQILQMYKDKIGQRIDTANAPEVKDVYRWQMDGFDAAIKALKQTAWIPAGEKLPDVDREVIVSLTDGTVRSGRRLEPADVWQVTDGSRMLWVYDPEAYTDDIDNLPKAKDCYFEFGPDDLASSITGVNYNSKFAGAVAWMPLPEPYRGGDTDAD